VVESKINEIGEELYIGQFEFILANIVIPKPKEFGESFRRNTQFMRSKYVPS